MSDTVIRVENLSKKYVIGHQRERYTALRDVITNGIKSIGNRFLQKEYIDSATEEFWALKDISFEIKQGDRVGIIGRNGAGKSTLLKILSRITEPTNGKISIKGRVASLLEVGTGFHPELTGRQNIYLNGAVLGMERYEIKKKFDEIVDFAEVEKFLDTPVKRYSSGMYVRLAFAVAAHLDPDILIVDEVLAVGDTQFQKKCLGKMENISGEGRTVLFVSHNIQAIRALCYRGILLDKGQIISNNSTEAILKIYNQRSRPVAVRADTDVRNRLNRRGDGSVRFTNIDVVNVSGDHTYHFYMGDTIRFILSYEVLDDIPELYVSIFLKASLNSDEFITSSRYSISQNPVKINNEVNIVEIDWIDISIRPGEYPLYFWLGNSFERAYDVVDDLTPPLSIQVSKEEMYLNFNPILPSGYFSVNSRLLGISK